MSAFVVDPETINRIIGFLLHSKRTNQRAGLWAEKHLSKIEFSLDDPQGLGQAMYNLNVSAVSQRYPGDDINDLPGSYEKGHLRPFAFRPMTTTGRFQALKSMRCWLYQCAEGTGPETALFKTFEEISRSLAMQIVDSLPEYDQADWG